MDFMEGEPKEVVAVFADLQGASAYNLVKALACIESSPSLPAKFIHYHQSAMKKYRQRIRLLGQGSDLPEDARKLYMSFAAAQRWTSVLAAFEQCEQAEEPAGTKKKFVETSMEAVRIIQAVEDLVEKIAEEQNEGDVWKQECGKLREAVHECRALAFIVHSLALMNSDVGVGGATDIFNKMLSLHTVMESALPSSSRSSS
eukprot:m.215161 g.215161  ORF g.215161 m.215161 type:complete len:201 (-) comp39744_c0_seq1:62-664(-)